jgi:hypothetical protein
VRAWRQAAPAVYDVLLTAVAAADAKSLRAHVDRRFLTQLLELFASEDPHERDRLKAAYHGDGSCTEYAGEQGGGMEESAGDSQIVPDACSLRLPTMARFC